MHLLLHHELKILTNISLTIKTKYLHTSIIIFFSLKSATSSLISLQLECKNSSQKKHLCTFLKDYLYCEHILYPDIGRGKIQICSANIKKLELVIGILKEKFEFTMRSHITVMLFHQVVKGENIFSGVFIYTKIGCMYLLYLHVRNCTRKVFEYYLY